MRAFALSLLPIVALGCGGTADTQGLRPRAASEPSALAFAQAAPDRATNKPSSPQDGPPSADALARKIIYTADVDLVVEDFTTIPSQVDELVQRCGGFIANSKVTGETGQS